VTFHNEIKQKCKIKREEEAMSNEKIRVGTTGLGGWAKYGHIPALQSLAEMLSGNINSSIGLSKRLKHFSNELSNAELRKGLFAAHTESTEQK
jgi:hypothetical protein